MTNQNDTLEHQAAVKNGVGRMAFTVLSMMVEFAIFLMLFTYLGKHASIVIEAMHIFSLLLVFVIYGQRQSPSFKMPWIMLILTLPVFGILLYLLIGLNGSTHRMQKEYEGLDKKLLPLLPEDEKVIEKERKRDVRIANLSHYIRRNSGFPVYADTRITYYDDAAEGIEAQKGELKKAERFIFMEYHAIEDAQSWRAIEDILVQKAASGVEVRVFYDDMGSIGFINTDFVEKLKNKGIQCQVFNAFAPGMNIFLNNRDHRKITVIDGKVGFTGGYNLANEYFHVTEPFGFWKDTGVRLVGRAVDSLTVMFLEMWNAIAKKKDADKDFEKYLRQIPESEGPAADEEVGFVQPYADSPLDDVLLGEDVYLSMSEMATDYIWFVTPYLIITDEMTRILSLAARRGVDVRIITPGIPDKKIIYSVTRSYYNGLVRNGVRIFEYTPGFCHAKMSITDDIAATCGTINMDYRSLYHHFENGCLIADCEAVGQIRRDFEKMFAESKDVSEYYRTGRGAFLRIGQMILRLFAPLM
ncbi:MAG: cardiolipin synthase [Lachnospiraceae bacterium]|nr:cardiolipin synthase [Lachnospiraceae bacterium]